MHNDGKGAGWPVRLHAAHCCQCGGPAAPCLSNGICVVSRGLVAGAGRARSGGRSVCTSRRWFPGFAPYGRLPACVGRRSMHLHLWLHLHLRAPAPATLHRPCTMRALHAPRNLPTAPCMHLPHLCLRLHLHLLAALITPSRTSTCNPAPTMHPARPACTAQPVPAPAPAPACCTHRPCTHLHLQPCTTHAPCAHCMHRAPCLLRPVCTCRTCACACTCICLLHSSPLHLGKCQDLASGVFANVNGFLPWGLHSLRTT